MLLSDVDLCPEMICAAAAACDPLTRRMLSMTCHEMHATLAHMHGDNVLADYGGYGTSKQVRQCGIWIERPFVRQDWLLAAIHYNNTSIVHWIRAGGYCRWDKDIFRYAAAHSNTTTLAWLLAHDCPINSAAATETVITGNLPNLMWLYLNVRCLIHYFQPHFAIEDAVRSGHLHIVQWLFTIIVFNVDVTELARIAVREGQLDILTWLRVEQKCELSARIFRAAVCRDNLPVMKYLRAEGCQWDASVFCAAAWHGDQEMLQWLHSENCPWDDSVLLAVVMIRGRSRIIKWLFTSGYPWMAQHMVTIIIYCDLPTLAWLRTAGCPWNKAIWEAAVSELTIGTNSRLEICDKMTLEWLRAEGCPET